MRAAAGRVEHGVADQPDHAAAASPAASAPGAASRPATARRARSRGGAAALTTPCRRRQRPRSRLAADREQLERLAHDVARDRRRDLGAALAVLDDHRHREARLDIGREADEQRVVAVGPGDVLALVAPGRTVGARDAPHLRGAGLAAHLDAGQAQGRGPGRAAGAVDDLAHAAQHDVQRGLRHPDRGRRLPRPGQARGPAMA